MHQGILVNVHYKWCNSNFFIFSAITQLQKSLANTKFLIKQRHSNESISGLTIHVHVWNWYLRTKFCWVRRKYSDHPWKRKILRELLCSQWLLIMTQSSKNCRYIHAETRQTCLLAFLVGWDSMGKLGPAPRICILADNKLIFNLSFVAHPSTKLTLLCCWL